ncbi:MATE family efflux transporter [Lachnospiraceae bacterium MD1]|jgi:putative MATE family efflux protein|uniref:Probable multidrug resistance protein NorM n=1 Tax=Variimorphobacter saccharofermentans TaxID=2755051 RepID=A0A839K378_9FIRM|nr:MATE family efflux transporter [Variimorphobacter saccharofermentans]MBB2183459.1 MATE family efflux transporter [Variimorphobacter saccharofermentans]
MRILKDKRYFGDMQFYKNALIIGIPVILQSLIQSLVSLIDSFMVSGLGDIKMSGVNISGQILFIFMILLGAVCASGGIFLTQFSGAKDKEGMQQAFAFKLVTSFLLAIFYFIVTMAFTRKVLSLMVIGNTQSDLILDQGEEYMFLMGFVGVQSIISYVIASSYREIGKVKMPLIISVTATLINTILNWGLIYGNLGMPRLEIKGAAYATIIARTIEMILFIIYVIIDKPDFIDLSVLKRVDFKMFGQILSKGSMIILSQMMWVISESITSAIYNGRGGADIVSGMAASFSIANLLFVSFTGITTTTGVIIGKSLGSNQLNRAKQEKVWMLSAALVFGCFMCLLGFSTTALVPIVFGSLSQSAQKICKGMLMLIASLMPIWTYVNTQLAVSRAGGDTKVCMWVDGGATLIMLPMLFLMAAFTNWSPIIMYLAVKVLDVGKIIIAHLELKKERWVVNLSDK